MAGIETVRERQWTTGRANQTTGLTNGRAANRAPEVAFCLLASFSLAFPSSTDVPAALLNQPNIYNNNHNNNNNNNNNNNCYYYYYHYYYYYY